MEEEVRKAVECLEQGKTILYPTDTVWGIGCDATNYKAVEKVYKIKRRFERKSLIILLENPDKIKDYVEEVPPIAFDLMKSMDTPLTIIYPRAKNLAKNVIAKDKSIAIRIVHEPFCHSLLSEFGKPIVSTSANISGESAPLFFNKITDEIKQSVDYIVGINQQLVNRMKPSTIIKLKENNQFEIIRK